MEDLEINRLNRFFDKNLRAKVSFYKFINKRNSVANRTPYEITKFLMTPNYKESLKLLHFRLAIIDYLSKAKFMIYNSNGF